MPPQNDFTCSIAANATAQQAFEAIINVSAWWSKDVKGSTRLLHDTFTVRFGETSGTFTITGIIPDRKIEWEVVDCHLPIFKNVKDWMGTSMTWEIGIEDRLTRIRFTHVGLVPGKECYTDCCGGWSFFVQESLLKLITEGKGLPGVGIRSTFFAGHRTYKGTLFFKSEPLPDLPGEYLLIDVKDLQGEHVASAYSVEKLDKKNFDPQQIRGNHYMIIEDKPYVEKISPLEDILETIQQ